MAAPGDYNHRPNVARAVTKKWRDASQANYDGDDWGDDDDYDDYGYPHPAPVSADNPRHPAWAAQNTFRPANRSATNPSPPRAPGRQSFDTGDDRRHFSSGAGFDSPYPTTQRSPFPEPEHDYDHEPELPQFHRGQPPLHVSTQNQPMYAPGGRPGSTNQQYPQYQDGPFSAPGAFPQPQSQSGHRSMTSDSQQSYGAGVRPDSRTSNTSTRFPPRKSSLSQQLPPPEIANYAAGMQSAQETSQPAAPETKALPFIRPADIYKRMEEERQKQRLSQESSRPSIDSGTGRPRQTSSPTRPAISVTEDQPSLSAEKADDLESMRRLKPSLDTVTERKSEYGMDHVTEDVEPQTASTSHDNLAPNMHRQTTNASSIYTNRPDPISASSTPPRRQSPDRDSPENDQTSHAAALKNNSSEAQAPPNEEDDPYDAAPDAAFRLPLIARLSSFGTGLTDLTPMQNRGEGFQSSSDRKFPGSSSTPINTSFAPLTTSTPTVPQTELGHKPSSGYKSVVQQTFDQSQEREMLSPTSATDTVFRSNSASTNDISPIMARHPESERVDTDSQTAKEPGREQGSVSDAFRPLAASKLQEDNDRSTEHPSTYVPIVQPGYRRANTPPSGDNSPAKRPVTIDQDLSSKVEHGIVSDAKSQNSDIPVLGARKDSAPEAARGRTAEMPSSAIDPSVISTFPDPRAQLSVAAPSSNRSTSEEYRDWQEQRKQFNARFGIQDSNPTTPGIPSPEARTSSPTKSSVRDTVEKYETRSNHSSPERGNKSSLDPASMRPVPNTRMESFRPKMPGGWQSASATPGLMSPAPDTVQSFIPPRYPLAPRNESTESIPTARPPQEKSVLEGVQDKAFAAAAAAGTALAGAFSGPAFSRSSADKEVSDSSDDEWDRSETSSKHDLTTSDTRDFAQSHLHPGTTHAAVVDKSLPPTPQPIETPAEHEDPRVVPQPVSAGDRTVSGTSSTADYFPAPLRTSQDIEAKSSTRPSIPTTIVSGESQSDGYNDRLQQEIMQSLTPTSSAFEQRPDSKIGLSRTASNEVLESPLNKPRSIDRESTSSEGDSVSLAHVPSNQHLKPSQAQAVEPPGSHKPQVSISTDVPATPSRPTLEQRYSWEPEFGQIDAPVTPVKLASLPADSPETIRGSSIRSPEASSIKTPTLAGSSDLPTEERLSKSPLQQNRDSSSSAISQNTAARVSGPQNSEAPMLGQAHAPRTSFRDIMGLNNQQDRIKAYNENKAIYATSDGLLEQWMLSMNTPEHSDAFSSAGRTTKAGADATTPVRPSPRRPSFGTNGPKQMQEEGKRLMTAAGRIGGKAGFAAKGLFAKGKDKLRAASASEKGFLTNRRKSLDPTSPEMAESPENPSNKRSSVIPSAPPQLPAPFLERTLTDEGSWSRAFAPRPEERTSLAHVPTYSSDALKASSASDNVSELTQRGPSEPHVHTVSPPTPRSPLVSDIASIYNNMRDLPSRSISEATRNTEAEPSTTATQQDYLIAPSIDSSTIDGCDKAHVTALAPIPLNQDNGQQTRSEENSNQLNNMSFMKPPGVLVSDPRRPSIVSNVSSPSPPLDSQEGLDVLRSISPPEQSVQPTERIPSYNPNTLTKEEEALENRKSATEDQLPAYEDNLGEVNAPRTSRIGPDAQIVPVADLSSGKRVLSRPENRRPFSFVGAENISRAQHMGEEQFVGDSTDLSNSIDQNTGQPASQFSFEKTPTNKTSTTASAERQKKSYSRPFGAESSMQDHPAQRQINDPVDRSRMYTSDSPLPSARRPQQQPEYARQRTPPVNQRKEEEGYRIPGPYVQEYRPPRRGSIPQPMGPSDKDYEAMLSGNGRRMTTTNPEVSEESLVPQNRYLPPPQPQPQSQSQPRPPVQYHPMAQPFPMDIQKSKQRTFGGLFGGKSKQQRDRQADPEPSLLEVDPTKQRKASLFGRNNQYDSMVPQQPGTEGVRNEQLRSTLPEANDKAGRRLSKDLLTLGVNSNTNPNTGKKKRFSAVGGLFSKVGKFEKSEQPQRSATISSNPNAQTGQDTYQQASSTSAPPFVRQSPDYPQSQNSDGRYYTPQQYQQQVSSPQQTQSRNNSYQQDLAPQGYTQRRSMYVDPTPTQSYQDQRPPGLRIDTGSSQPGQTGSVRNYPVTTAPANQARERNQPSSSKFNHRGAEAAHVINLHKRSRSPRLGRRSSSEERQETASISNNNLGGSFPGGPRNISSAPVEQLGIFSKKKLSPTGGVPRHEEDQEKPFRLTLPGESREEDERKRRSRQMLIEQSGAMSESGGKSTSLGTGGSQYGGSSSGAGPAGPSVSGMSGLGSVSGAGSSALGGQNLTVAERMAGPQHPGSVVSSISQNRSLSPQPPVETQSHYQQAVQQQPQQQSQQQMTGQKNPSPSKSSQPQQLPRNLSPTPSSQPLSSLAPMQRSLQDDNTPIGTNTNPITPNTITNTNSPLPPIPLTSFPPHDHRPTFVAELPGSKAEGYESEEEISMSATAYPGDWQDMPMWVPNGDGKWDD